MADKILELEKQLSEQDKQIKKLVIASLQTEKRIIILDKKLAREHHTVRTLTNTINTIMQMLNKGR